MLTLLSLALAQDTIETPPVAPQLPGFDGSDPHLWLEDVLGEEPLAQVKTWNEATLSAYRADPRFQAMQDAALEVLSSDARLATGPIRVDDLYNFWRDAEHTRGVWRRTPLKSFLAGSPEWEVLLDVDALAEEEGENWIWHGATCAPKSDRCLVELSRGGKDAAVVREYDREARTWIADGFQLEEAKSDVAFVDEDTVLVGTDFGEGSLTESGYPMKVARWTRGQALSEAPIVAEGQPTDVSESAWVLHHGKEAVTVVSRGRTFYESDLSLLDDSGLTELPFPDRAWLHGLFRGRLLVQVHEPWTVDDITYGTGTLVAYDLDDGSVQTVLAPADGESLEGVSIGKKSVFVQMLSDVQGQLRRLTPKKGAWQSTTIGLPANGQVALVGGSDSGDDVLVTFESLTQPVTLFHVDKKDAVHELTSLPASYDASDVVVEQRFATSTDGTKVPYFLMARRDVLESGPAPTIQYGYGGFQAAILPTYFRESARPQQGAFIGPLWVKDGGVLVLSNIRGGSEYGPEWHQAALKANRQKAYDDFFAIGEQLVEDGVTTPAQLGAIGRSNGGLLMGVVLTQRPDLYRAVDIGVPLLDMLRYDKLLAGASWVGEYGDPDDAEERKTLEEISPYHNLDPEADYPHVLFYTSTRDDRVHPGHARKMAAALESMGVAFDYWENIEGGHGGVANKDQAALRIALELLYFKRELGLD